MRLLPGYAPAPRPAKSLVVHRAVRQASTAVFVDAAAFEVVPNAASRARATSELLGVRTAIQLYSSVSRINEPESGRLNVFA